MKLMSWVISAICLLLAASALQRIFTGTGLYVDYIYAAGGLVFGLMLLPGIQSFVLESKYFPIIRIILGTLFVAWLILPIVRIDLLQQKSQSVEQGREAFDAVVAAAQKYCKDQGKCADRIEELIWKGYLPDKRFNAEAGTMNYTIEDRYSSVSYSPTGNGTSCTISLNVQGLPWQNEHKVAYCSVK